MGVTQAEFARLRKASKQSVSLWKKQGLLVLDQDGTINVKASNKALDARPPVYRGGKTQRGASEDPAAQLESAATALLETGARPMVSHAEALRRKENYLALLKELEYDRDSGAVVEVAEVAKQVSAEYAVVRAKLIGIPARVAGRIAALRSPEEIKALLDGAISEALAGLTLDTRTPGDAKPL